MAFGWSIGTWGQGEFGTGVESVTVEVYSPTDLAWSEGTWGQGTFGGVNNLTINLESVSIGIGVIVTLTGEELIHALESNVGISAGGSVQIPVFENPLITNLNNVNIIGTGLVNLTGQNLTTALNSVTAIPSIEVPITGQNLTTVLNSVVVEIPIVVSVTGQNLTTALNSVTAIPSIEVPITGQNLTLALGNENAFTDITVNVIGQNLTGTTGQLFVTAWAEVNTGQTITWTDVAA